MLFESVEQESKFRGDDKKTTIRDSLILQTNCLCSIVLTPISCVYLGHDLIYYYYYYYFTAAKFTPDYCFIIKGPWQ